MPRITATVPPPPIDPPASVRAQRRTTARPAATARQAVTAPVAPVAADAAPTEPSTASVAPAAAKTTPAAADTVARLRPTVGLLAVFGKTDADLDRWLADGLPLRTYRTPDGDRFADPADLLAALAERRPTTDVGVPAGNDAAAVAR